MNNERYNQIIDEAYENYRSKSNDINLPENLYNELIDDLNKDAMFPIDNPNRMLSQEGFINKCKTNSEFSERWELKIEENRLSLEERYKLALPIWKEKYGLLSDMMIPTNVDNTPYKIPTKLITITYSNQTIQVYE